MDDNHKIQEIIEHHQPEIEESVNELIDRLALVFWSTVIDNDHHCSFCNEPASKYNEEIMGFDQTATPSKYSTGPLYICESCMYDLETGDFDVENPDDHSLSQGLGEIVRDWANRKLYVKLFAFEYFGEHGITRDHCDICNSTITNDGEIAISVCGTYVAHEQCARHQGFNSDAIDVHTLVGHLGCSTIIHMINNPEYSPPVSPADKERLNEFVRDNWHTYDFSELRAFAAQFSIPHWIPIAPGLFRYIVSCNFCLKPATMRNKYIDIRSCDTCHTSVRQVDIAVPHSANCDAIPIRHHLQIRLNKIFHLKTTAQVLYQNYGIQYRRCRLCRKIIQSNEDVAVTNRHFAHFECLGSDEENYWYSTQDRFHSKITLNDVINLPNFDVDTVNRLIKQ